MATSRQILLSIPPSRQLGIQNSTLLLDLERCFLEIKHKELLHLQQNNQFTLPKDPKAGCFRQTVNYNIKQVCDKSWCSHQSFSKQIAFSIVRNTGVKNAFKLIDLDAHPLKTFSHINSSFTG